jgi:hypothetical protein
MASMNQQKGLQMQDKLHLSIVERITRTTTMANVTKTWLATALITDDPAGDLIADMRREQETMPSLFKNIRDMRAYLVSRRACPEALAAVPAVWRRYSKWLMRHPTGTRAVTGDR